MAPVSRDYNSRLKRRILFVIRGKLGDTLVAYATVRAWADSHPDDDVSLLVRANYVSLFAAEAGVRVIGFSSRLQMLARLLWMRIAEPAWDALLVLWGFGKPVQLIGRMVSARRKVYLDGRFPAEFPEYARVPAEALQSEPMWRVAQVFEPAFVPPDRLHVPSLALRRRADAQAIGIAPLADEARRIISPESLSVLLAALARMHPGRPLRVFLNRADRGAKELIEAGLPAGASFVFFPTLDALVSAFEDLAHLYCTDTGLYHLAAAMQLPSTVFYGPTRPHTNMFPAQPHAVGLRLEGLGSAHCEVKDCASPLCLDAAVATVAEVPAPTDVPTPPACPLRALPVESLVRIAAYEGSRRKA